MSFFKKALAKEALLVALIGFMILGFILFKRFSVERRVSGQEYTAMDAKGESCISCHTQNTGFSVAHNPKKIGCVSCHLGNPKVTNKEGAHKNMVLIPGNLSNAKKTCGKCHANELSRVEHSLMATNSGIVAVDKFVFGEAATPNGHYHIKDIKYSAADKHLRDLCANCHLGAEKSELGQITQLSRGGGCNACHLNYSEGAKNNLKNYLDSNKKQLPTIHPSTDIFVKNEHCFGCHSRSSRIATNYEGWHETLFEKKDILNKEGYKVFEDGRIYSYQGEDVHHAKGMLCIDCHSSHEVMGDGKKHLHEEDAVTLTCTDCHYKEKPTTLAYNDLDAESSLVFLHRKYSHSDKKILAVKKDGHPLVNTYVDEKGAVFLIGKKDGALRPIHKQSEVCSRDAAHKNVSCSACHAQWAPRCIGCHNSFDENDIEGYDLLDKKKVIGQWIEYISEFALGKPALGVREKDGKRIVEPAIPGMIMTIDHASYKGSQKNKNSFHRLYAPNSPHTITKKSRSCTSCHSDPVALGYGIGKLVYTRSKGYGEWQFTAGYALNPNDGLPEDAWVPFLKKPKATVFSTRTNFRPFTVKEQRRMLLVGACLQCHQGDGALMRQTIKEGLDSLLLKVSGQCILPKE